MKMMKGPLAIVLLASTAFSCALAQEVEEITCDSTNTTDFKAVAWELFAPHPRGNPVPVTHFWVENVGTNRNWDRLYFDIHEVDENGDELAYIKMVYNDDTVMPGEQLRRSISFTDFHMSEGRHYKGVIRYACDPNPSNDVLYRTAFTSYGSPWGDNIFSTDFEGAAAMTTAP